jgi:hypothetical protein
MKNWKLMLSLVPFALLLAMVPQDPGKSAPGHNPDTTAIIRLSEMQYVDLSGNTHVVPARNVLEIRLLESNREPIQVEVVYENGDYSLINAQALHILTNGTEMMDVRLVRSEASRIRFPKLR